MRCDGVVLHVMVSCWSGYDGVVDVVCSCVVLLMEDDESVR